ncbi:MAG: polysaccharide pyruvyl transferase family protein, partial [Planctomycetota bacterium]
MTYDYKRHFNVGDYIQSLAAEQFLPKIDRYINREHLNEYSGPRTRLIMNGWFTHNPKSWPPSPDIVPLFVSFHLSKKAAEAVLNERGVAYLKKYEVGARDPSTLELLKAKGINAFFSGCLTLTLGNIFHHQPGTDIYFVDVLFKPQFIGRRKRIIRKLFGDDITRSAKWIKHTYPSSMYKTEESRFQLANDILSLYQKAKLVVTSRLHCALP